MFKKVNRRMSLMAAKTCPEAGKLTIVWPLPIALRERRTIASTILRMVGAYLQAVIANMLFYTMLEKEKELWSRNSKFRRTYLWMEHKSSWIAGKSTRLESTQILLTTVEERATLRTEWTSVCQGRA